MKNKKSIFIRQMKVLENRLFLYLFSIFCMTVADAGFLIISSFLTKYLIDVAQSGKTQNLAVIIAAGFMGGVVLLFIWKFSTVTYNVEAKRGIAALEKEAFSKAMRLPMEYYENTHSGDFMSKLIYDVQKAGDIFGSRFRRLVAPVISVIIYLIPMFLLCWQITLCLVAVNILALGVNTLFVKPMKKIGKETSEKHGIMTEKLSNILAGMEQAKIFAVGQELKEDYVKSNQDFKKAQKEKGILSSCLESLNQGFDLVSALAFLVVGVFFVSRGITSVGDLAAIYIMYGSLSWEFLQIGRYIPELMNCLANTQKVFDFVDIEEEPLSYHVQAADGEGYLELQDICFAYNDERMILDKFSMSVKKGDWTALVGESGKGKSTVAKLLLGFYKPLSGKISIAGKAYGDMELSEIRSLIGYVPQEPYLYNVSILQNILYGRPDASEEEVIEAAKAANAHDFILKQEKGYDTIAGERGNRLSGGEKQRIAIARAILKNAPILILDEATSALDNESEKLVSEALDRLMYGRTTVMIAHRPSTIERADVVVSL